MHRVLREALKEAVNWRLLARNPTERREAAPRSSARRCPSSTPTATVELIEAARRGTSIFIPILLGVLCGLRRGEIAALRWRSVDLDTGTLSARGKHRANEGRMSREGHQIGKERVRLPFRRLLIDELRPATGRGQAEELLQLWRSGSLADDSRRRPGGRLIAATEQLDACLHNVPCPLTGLKRVRLHDLRHSHATHLLAGGVHPKVASERLGHSKVGITLDLYSHVMPGMQAEAAASLSTTPYAARPQREVKTANGSKTVATGLSDHDV